MRPASYPEQPYQQKTNPQYYEQPVRRPPVFIRTPNSQYHAEGETARFDATISSASKAKVTWMHNNKSLMASSRYRNYFDGQSACLIITGISEYDQGIYTLIVENRDGFDSCNAELRITGPKVINASPRYRTPYGMATQSAPSRYPTQEGGIDTTSYIPAQQLARLESQRMQATRPMEGPLVDNRPIVNLQGIRELELRRQQRQQRRDDIEPGIDSHHIVSPSLLKHTGDSADVIQKQLRKFKTDTPSAAPRMQPKRAPTPTRPQDAVDTRPIVDPSVFANLESKLSHPKLKDDDLVVDTRPIVDPSAFRYLERKPVKSRETNEPRAVVDSSSIVDPSAFKYIERPAYPPQTVLKESVVDTRPIVDPRAFRILELPLSRPVEESNEPEIDTRPLVDPAAFRYIEPSVRKRLTTRRSSAQASIDTSSLIDQNAFKHLERASEDKVKDSRPEIDTTPMVPPEAFKYIEPRQRTVRRRRPTSPSVDTTSYVDNRPLLVLEHSEQPKPEIQPGIDDSSYVPESAFLGLEHRPAAPRSSNEPVVDSRPIISPEAFRALEKEAQPALKDVLPEIDDRPYINPLSIASLENRPQRAVVEAEETGIAPQFLNQLNDIRAQEGDTVTMSTTLVASPLPDVTWYKNNKQLEKSSRIFYFINMNTKMAVLTIKGVYHEDEGIYTLVAHNKFGEASTSATLVIAQQPAIDNTNFVPLECIRDLELKSGGTGHSTGESDDILMLAKPSKGQGSQAGSIAVATKKEKPIFKRLMQDQTAAEGSTVKMYAEVGGLPTPELTLLRDSDILLESSRLKFDYDFNNSLATVIIKDVSKLDNGVYTILAKNEKGVASNFARLTVIESKDTVAVAVPVRVVLQSTKLSAKEGDDFEAVFSVTGVPIPVLSVLFNGQEIYASSRTTIVHNFFEKKATIKIKSAQLCDAGRYTLKADQQGHVESAYFDFVVEGADSILTASRLPEHALDHLQKVREEKYVKSGVDQTCYAHDPDKLKELEKPHMIKEQPVEKKSEAPSFESVLRPVKAIEGRQAVLKVKFKGKPFPEVFWFKEGSPVELSSRISSFVDMAEKFAALLIKSLRFSDQGIYEVRLANIAGQVSQSAALTILPDVKEPVDKTSYIDLSLIENLEEKPPEQDDVIAGVDSKAFVDPTKFKYLTEGNIYKLEFKEDTSAYREPQILQPLAPRLSLKELDTITLQCLVESYPLPLVRWLKDGQDLVGSSRFKMDYNMITKLCSLTITDARPYDSGMYRVIVKNPLGEKSCECQVEVLSDKNIDTRAFISPEAFSGVERHEPKREEVTAGIDSSTYFDQKIFKTLEESKRQVSAPVAFEPAEEPLAIQNKQHDCTVNEGTVIFLFATISGNPISQVQWFHNGALLSASSRIAMDVHMASKTCWLQISASTIRDKGIYNMFASNKMGSVSAQFYVDVLQGCDIERTAYISQQAFEKLEHKDNRKLKVEPGVDNRGFVNFEKFACLERGVAEATARDVIPEIDRRSFIDAEKFAKLEQKHDAHVIEDKTETVGMPPTIKMPLRDQNIQEGAEICVLRAVVNGKPVPEITWLKENSSVAASSRIKSDYDMKTKIASLHISKIAEGDQGMYRLLAKNSFGSVESSCSLFVISAAGIDESSHLGPATTITSVEKPEFVKSDESDKFVLDEDDNFVAEFSIRSSSAFKLTLLKDGKLVQMSNRLDFFHNITNNTVTIKLRRVVVQDAGVYVCIAENQIGRAEKQFTLDVKSKLDQSRNWIVPNKEAIEALMKEPVTEQTDIAGNEVDTTSFLKDRSVIDALERKSEHAVESTAEPVVPLQIAVPLSDLVVSEMSTAVLHASLSTGNKPDSVLWTVNDQQLGCSNRFHLQSVLNELYLRIEHCTVGDSGVYKLLLKNSLGSVETSAKLTVIPADNLDPQRDILQYQALEEGKVRISDDQKEERRPSLKAKSLMADKTHCSEGQLIELKMLLKNGPAEQVEWYRNDAKLDQSSRYTTIYNHELCILALRIESLILGDQGKYSVQLFQQSQPPLSLFITQLFVSQSSGIDTTGYILSLEQLMALEPKVTRPVDDSQAGIDSTNYISLQNFERLEQPPVREDVVKPGVDTTGYIPLTAFERLEQERKRAEEPCSPTLTYDPHLLEMLESGTSNKPELSVVECHDTLEHSCTIGKMSDIEVEEHGDFKLTCSFASSSPNCQVYWFFNNCPLEMTARHRVECDHSTSTISLFVSSARMSDSGIYTAIIMTADQQSRASTYAHVQVIPSKGVDTQPIVHTKFESIAREQAEQEQNYPQQVKFLSQRDDFRRAGEAEVQKSQLATQQPKERKKLDPPIIETLSCDNTALKEGDSAHFQAIVHGEGLQVTWQINGRLATGSSRFAQKSTRNQYELTISPVRQFDQGELKVTARNSGGQVQKVCVVIVQLDASTDRQDEILLGFCARQNARSDEFTKLREELLTWVQQTPDNQRTDQTIEEFLQRSWQNILQGQQGTDRVEEDKSVLESNELQFVSKIRSASVIEGGSVLFTFKLNHRTEATVRWLRGKFPISNSKFVQIVFDGLSGALLLKKVYADDEEDYNCVIEAGGMKLQCSGRLHVHKSASFL